MNDYYARTICCLFYNVGEIGWSLIQFTVANLYIIKLVRTFSRKWCLSEAPTLHCPRISSPSLLLHLAKGVRGQRALQDLREGMGVGAGTEHSFQHLCSKKGPLLATAAPIPYPRTFSALSLWRDFLFFSFFERGSYYVVEAGPESQRSPVSLVLGLNAYTYTSGIIRDFWIGSMVKKYSSSILQGGGCHGMMNKMS